MPNYSVALAAGSLMSDAPAGFSHVSGFHPSDAPTTRSYFEILTGTGNDTFQLVSDVLSNDRFFYRIKVNGAWGSWGQLSIDIPSFYKDYSTLASLATVLCSKVELFNSSSDADNYTANGIYYLNSARTLTHFPGSEGSGILIVLHPKDNVTLTNPEYYGWHQIWLERRINKIFVRCKWPDSEWTSWREI